MGEIEFLRMVNKDKYQEIMKKKEKSQLWLQELKEHEMESYINFVEDEIKMLTEWIEIYSGWFIADEISNDELVDVSDYVQKNFSNKEDDIIEPEKIDERKFRKDKLIKDKAEKIEIIISSTGKSVSIDNKTYDFSPKEFEFIELLITRATQTNFGIDKEGIEAELNYLEEQEFKFKNLLKDTPERREFKKEHIKIDKRGNYKFDLTNFDLIDIDEKIEAERIKKEEEKSRRKEKREKK